MLRWLRRHFGTVAEIPVSAWHVTIQRYPFLIESAGHDIERLRQLAADFLNDKEFHGAHGFVVTDEVALAVAAQAVLPLLHMPRGLSWYDDFVGIVMHPAEVVARRVVTDETGVVHEYDEVLAGEAMDRGPVMLSWQDVLAGGITADGFTDADTAANLCLDVECLGRSGFGSDNTPCTFAPPFGSCPAVQFVATAAGGWGAHSGAHCWMSSAGANPSARSRPLMGSTVRRWRAGSVG